MRAVLFLSLFLIAACASRPLTEAERRFTDTIMGPELDTSRVRITRGAAVGLLTATIPPKPRTTCREKLLPPRDIAVKGTFPAFVTFDQVYYTRKHWRADFLNDYPDSMTLREAMRFAHEMVHVWQWQNRATTRYHPVKAMFEHVESDDPYLIEIDEDRAFLDYGYEQQGVIVEEFICCRALDPGGARTARLQSLVGEVFPTAIGREAVQAKNISLPWEGAEINGICS